MPEATDVQEMRDTFGRLHGMNPDGLVYRKLCQILDDASDEALKALVEAKIKFVSLLAFNRCLKRGVV